MTFRIPTRSLIFLLVLACSSGGGDGPGPTPDSGAAVIDVPGLDVASDDAAAEDVPSDTDTVESPRPRVTTCTAPAEATVPQAFVPEGFCAAVFAFGLSDPRGLRVAPGGDVLVVERGLGRITALFDGDGDGVSGPAERVTLASAPGLNHGLALTDAHLYASSSTTVYRWDWTPGARSPLGEAQVVVSGIPAGGHSTRTLALDAQWLYVSIGSQGNVDPTSIRSRIVRFPLGSLDQGTREWGEGEVFADGLRNEVGLDFDAQGRLWGVENGVDNLTRADLGGDIHADNPAEELNRFDSPGAFYGYPYCWSEFILPAGVGLGPNTQWAHPVFMNDGTHTDAWCRDPANVVPPRFSLQAHSAPLDLHFYEGGSFPDEMVGDAFVTLHGSWNRPVPTGYKVVRVRFDAGAPVEVLPVFEYAGPGDIDVDWPHRPVALDAGPEGQLYVSSDKSDTVFVIGYDVTPR